MLPLFSYPLMLAGAAALPALAAIYWLRNRFRRHTVSSLMLWMQERQVRGGGTRLQRFQSPLLFFLELLILALLTLAAAGPEWRSGTVRQPLVVVLDDSFSMTAGGADSTRQRAVAALEEELHRHSRYSTRFILAGPRPQILGDPAHSTPEALKMLEQWKCRAPDADLDAAVTLAAEIGGERAVLLVLTDHAPKPPPGTGRLEWWAFGKPGPNVAFINAARTSHEHGDRCLLEIANLSKASRETSLAIRAGEPPVELERRTLALDPGAKSRIILNLKEGTPVLEAALGDDDLEIDNHVTLLPQREPPVRVEVRVHDSPLRDLVEKAVRASRASVLTAARPDLIITDSPVVDEPPAWMVQMLSEPDAQAYSGPFVVDRAHPLTEGLALAGVVWGAGRQEKLVGVPIVTAGNIPLVSDVETGDGGHEITVRLRPELSTLQNSPNWPILIDNLLRWRASRRFGLARVNLRLGEEAALSVPSDVTSAKLMAPDGTSRTIPSDGGQLAVRPDDVGIYRLEAGGADYAFAVNALRRAKSDLRDCVSGRWGEWSAANVAPLEYRSAAWLLLLGALGILTLHVALVACGRGGDGA